MKGKTKEYRTYEWLAESCIESLDEEVEKRIVKTALDCIYFTKGYCKSSGCIPVEVMDYITDLEREGKIK